MTLDLFFAGQITGVEGYVESVATGWLAGLNAVRSLRGQTIADGAGTLRQSERFAAMFQR